MLDIVKGSTVKFVGFTEGEDPPDNAELLEAGTEYRVADALPPEDAGDEWTYELEVENPDFDDSKRATKTNPRTLTVAVFPEEVEALEAEAEDEAEDEEVEEQQTAAPKTTKKRASKKKAATKKTVTKKKVASKKKAATKKAAAPVEVDEEGGIYDPHTDPELKDMIILSDDEEDQEILTLVNEADDIVELAREQADEAAMSDYRLGGVLYHIKLQKSYKEVNGGEYAVKKGWESFLNKEIGIEYRKGQYLIDIYCKFNKFGIGHEAFATLGWTKASQISRVMTEDNAEDLVALAEDSTVSELKESISESYSHVGATKGTPVKKVTFKFRLVEDSGVTVRALLEQAMQSLGYENESEAFEHVITEWAQDHLDVTAMKKAKSAARKAKTAAKSDAEETKAPAKTSRSAAGRKAASKKTARRK